MSRRLHDDQIEEELQRLFGLPDDPEVSEDDYEPEPETVTDLDVSNVLDGFDTNAVPFCTEVEVPLQEMESSSSDSLHLEKPSTSSAEVQPLASNVPSVDERHCIYESSSTEISSHSRRVQDSPTLSTSALSDTDESDTDENEWKNVIFSQNPDKEYFDSVRLEHKQSIPSRTRPITYFLSFFDKNVFDLLVEQTNIYAEQNRSRGWAPVIKAFLGVIILMGLHPLPAIDLYWSSDPFFRVAEIASVMTCKRFKKILENIHLNDNSKMPARGAENYDKLFKVRPILELLNTAWQRSAKTATSQSIDESMIQLKGILSLKQYMPHKPIKRGYKVWTRADSETGYVYEFQIYTGKRDDQSTELGLGANVVKSLTQKTNK